MNTIVPSKGGPGAEGFATLITFMMILPCMSVISVENPSAVAFLLLCTREFILVRNPMNAVTVGKLLIISQLLRNM